MKRLSRALVCIAFCYGLCAPIFAAEALIQCDFYQQEKAQRNPGPALVAQVPAAMTPINLNAVQITDRKIARKIMIQGVYARRTPTNTLEVMTRMVNCTDYPQHLQLRSSFMDDQQFPIENTSAWQRVFLEPRSAGVYQESSIGTLDVAYFLIELKEGD